MDRRIAALAAVVLAVATAGCTGLVLGDGASFAADPAAVENDSLSSTGYEHVGTAPVPVVHDVQVVGQQRRIEVTNWVATYRSDLEVQGQRQQAGLFVVATTPSATVFGQSLNPLAGADNLRLLERFAGDLEGEYGELQGIRKVDERTEPVLGQETTVTTFAANTTVEDEPVTINVHVTQVRHEGDIVIAIGAHPESFQQEAPDVHALTRAIEHPVEPPEGINASAVEPQE